MILQILTPVSVEKHQAEAVFLPGASGAFEVLPGHAPIISTLEAGLVRWRDAGKEESLPLSGGMAMVRNDVITVCIEG